MSNGLFEMIPDRKRDLIRITFYPVFWSPGCIGEFIRDYIAAVDKLDCELGSQRTIVDLRHAILQSQETIEGMQRVLADESSGRAALIAETPMARMQTKRLQVRPAVRMFADMASAEAWLLDGSADLAA